MNVDMQNPFAG